MTNDADNTNTDEHVATGAAWPPKDSVRIAHAQGPRMALRRKHGGGVGDGLPGVQLDEWLRAAQERVNPAGTQEAIVVTQAGLTPEVGRALVAKAAECVRGVELLDRLMASPEALAEIGRRTGLDEETTTRTLNLKRADLVRRRDGMQAALDAPIGFSLLIEVNGDKFSIG